jgi:nicotinamide-nucleotide amidase
MVSTVEIICVGNELLIGKVLNTNANWLCKRFTVLGLSVRRVTVVADVVEEIAAVVREVLSRKPRFVISTGGLGPTFDDMTLEGIARGLDRKLGVDEEALKMVKDKYESFARTKNGDAEMTQPRVKMATFPQGGKPISNPVGTAPGVRINVEETMLIALPGVPSEMEAIFEQTIVPLLKQVSDGLTFHEKSIYANNIMESSLAPLIDKVMRDNPTVYIKSHPRGRENAPHMEIHLSAMAKNSDDPEIKLDAAKTQLAELIEKNNGKIVSNNPASSNLS